MPGLVLNGSNISVRRERGNLIIQRKNFNQETVDKITPHLADIDRVIIIGHPSVPISILQTFMYDKIPVSFISEQGSWYGTLHPDKNNNVERRILQYRMLDNKKLRLKIARKIVMIKIMNQRRALQRLASNRSASKEKEIVQILSQLKKMAFKAEKSNSLDSLRGVEGSASAGYFRTLGSFFPEDIPFIGRNRRPPKDPANSLLSFCYSIVLSEVDTAIRLHGLDPCLGWFHEAADGNTALSYDLQEPLRAPVCDLLVLNILNHSILKINDFKEEENGAFYLKEDARKKFFIQYDKHMERNFSLPHNDAKVNFRECIRHQVWGVLRLLDNPACEDDGLFRMP